MGFREKRTFKKTTTHHQQTPTHTTQVTETTEITHTTEIKQRIKERTLMSLLDKIKGKKAVEVQEFEPVVKTLAPQSRVKMLITVSYEHHDGPTFEAGKEYWVDAEVADNLILKSYATGELSRGYPDSEVGDIRAGNQVLTLPTTEAKEITEGTNG